MARTRISIGGPLLKLRSDEQLVALFRAGHDEAFRVIHDRYRQRLFAYTRQMLPGSRQDAEDALQDIFVRAYAGLRANDRRLALRAWLYRVAHNRCIDELRRPVPPPPEVLEMVRAPVHDPTAAAEQRESLRGLIADLRRLPEQQRSALLMRELGGMSYFDVAAALGVSVPAVKSLLVRARVSLARALEARDTDCSDIREELIVAHDRGVRPSGMARRHLRDCAGCREFRGQVRGVSTQFAALVPTLGPLGVVANVLGIGGGAGASTGGTAVAAGGAVGTGGAAASIGIFATGAGHVATLLAAAVVTAGGAVEIQHTITAPPHHRLHQHAKTVGAAAAISTAVVDQSSSPAGPTYAAPASDGPMAPAAAPSPPAAKPAHRRPKTTADAGSLPTTPGVETYGVITTPASTGTTTGTPASGTGTSTGTGSSTGSDTTGSSTGDTGATGATSSTTGKGTTSSDGTSASTTGTPTPSGSATGQAAGTTGSGSHSTSTTSQPLATSASTGSGSASSASDSTGTSGSSTNTSGTSTPTTR